MRYEETYESIARERVKAALPIGWRLTEFSARELESAGKVVATVEWPDHTMTIDIATTNGGVEAATEDVIHAFSRLALQVWRA